MWRRPEHFGPDLEMTARAHYQGYPVEPRALEELERRALEPSAPRAAPLPRPPAAAVQRLAEDLPALPGGGTPFGWL